jgi:ubiquinone/menaquinone biosynthesis C-methylase UbiE
MDYLSSGFSQVDRSQDPGIFITCLQTLCSLPYFRDYKKKSFKLLNLGVSSKILEVGCGLGQDAIAIARMLGEEGNVIAIDSSRKMIKSACKDPMKIDSVQLCLSDACNLPFRDGSFDGARADRVLQHISEPRRAFAEMVRTVRVKGRLVVYEPDWGTFIISPGQKEICRTMTQLFGDTFPSGWIGRQLPGYFREEGLERIQIKAETFSTDDLNLAISVFDLVNTAQRAERMGYVSESQVNIWLEDLRRANRQGRFFCSYTGFLVSGEKAVEFTTTA